MDSKRYLGMVANEGKELVLQKGGDVDGRGDGAGMVEDGGSIISYDKEVVWGVATSDHVVWLC